ncbi:tryptophan--tRNA ligase [Megasphaera paucivorans]|uniref:Tryptophan--tRNA ligase n=1 Tax=Megasphaera paucivorans TaxID=349095 RepID=A0A1G9T3N2_9FIRM|nr:tryptophan--tRNA ligase [Megasphaera paucivorans]SDM42333.1 tryptophanyl-tRNA synthetase [Megasphaera paucivorans]
MSIIFSGIQPSGNLTLGNYLGALRNFSKVQKDNECYYCVVNQHAITVPQDPQMLHERTRTLAAIYIASGLDPDKSTLFVQSEVPEHVQLGWIMTCSSYVGELERMTQYKDKSAKQGDSIPAGLLTYPPLMAADILLYQTNLVPVGDDQKQHMEITRDLAQRFNRIYGDVFTVPDILLGHDGTRVMSLQEPTKKMSKSDDNQTATIYLLDAPKDIEKKIKRAQTDSENSVHYDVKNKPGISNLMDILAAVTEQTHEQITAAYADKGYGAFKKDVADAVVSVLEPIQQRYTQLIHDPELDKILEKGAAKAHAKANVTYQNVCKAIGLYR